MVNSCSAYGCKNRNAKGSQITFHRFPLNNKSLLKLWLYQIKRGNWEPSKYSVICSEHFTEDCFVVKGIQNSRRTLKSDAYPTIFSMAIYSEPPKKKTFPGRKSAEDVLMSEDSKEESISANDGTKEENASTNSASKEENASAIGGTNEKDASANGGTKEENSSTNDGSTQEEESMIEDTKEENGELLEKMEDTAIQPDPNTEVQG